MRPFHVHPLALLPVELQAIQSCVGQNLDRNCHCIAALSGNKAGLFLLLLSDAFQLQGTLGNFTVAETTRNSLGQQALCHVVVLVLVLLVSLHVISVDQTLDALLQVRGLKRQAPSGNNCHTHKDKTKTLRDNNICWTQLQLDSVSGLQNCARCAPFTTLTAVCGRTHLDGELELVVELADEQVVAERLPHLHDAHDGGVDLVLPVVEHALRRRHVLLRLRRQKHKRELFSATQFQSESLVSKRVAISNRWGGGGGGIKGKALQISSFWSNVEGTWP